MITTIVAYFFNQDTFELQKRNVEKLITAMMPLLNSPQPNQDWAVKEGS